jgi:hypothetical protein
VRQKEENVSRNALEANRKRLLNLAWYVYKCPKEKGEEELRNVADKILAGKTAMERLAKEWMQSKESEVIDRVCAMA